VRSLVTGVVAAATVATVFAVAIAGPAMGDGTADAWNDGESVGGSAQGQLTTGGEPARPTSSNRRRSGKSNPCAFSQLEGEDAAAAEGFANSGWSSAKQGEGPGKWYRKVCTDEQGQSKGTVVWVADREAVEPVVLAEQAAERVAIPEPSVNLNPSSAQDQIVNLATVLWVDSGQWQPVTTSASAAGVTANVAARPLRVEWDMGNGDNVTCEGPGMPYDPSSPDASLSDDACQYTYRRSSAAEPNGAFTVTATTVWEVSWDAEGAPGGGSLGLSRRSTSFPVRVAEIQAVNQ
jgi:hypothetical protein